MDDSYSVNNTRYTSVKKLYQKYHTQPWFQLLTEAIDRERLRKLFEPNEASGRELLVKYQTLRAEESAKKRAASLAKK